MALSTTVWTIASGDVGKTSWDLAFEGATANPPGYLAKSHVTLWINDIQVTVGGGATEFGGSGITFTWVTATNVQTTGYAGVLDDKVEFRRTIPKDKPYVDFVDRAGITESQLDAVSLANLYSIHEIMDGFGTGIYDYYSLAKAYAEYLEDVEVETGTYSAKHYSIKAAASAAAAAADEILTNADAAATAADAVATAADAASTAAAAATAAADAISTAADRVETNLDQISCDADATAAAASAAAALVSEGNAADSETAAGTSETNAANSETAAGLSETNAAASELKAEDWAEEDEDVEVEVGKYSAKHWAAKSAATGDYVPIGGNDTNPMTGKLELDGTVYDDDNAAVPKSYVDQTAAGTNLLINGNFNVWQRATSISGPLLTKYSGPDRWVLYDGADGSADIDRMLFDLNQTDVPGFPEFYLRYDFTAGSTGSPGIYQFIENVKRFGSGDMTFSFWAKVGSGTYNLTPTMWQFFGSAGDAYVQTDAADVTVTTSWQKFEVTITLPSISGKSISGGDDALYTGFVIPIGTSVQLDLAQCKVEYGSVATPFVSKRYDEELLACMRYYQDSVNAQHTRLSVGYTTTGNTFYQGATFPVEMRDSPSITINDVTESGAGFNSIVVGDIGIASESLRGFRWNVDSVTTSTAPSSVALDYSADAEL